METKGGRKLRQGCESTEGAGIVVKGEKRCANAVLRDWGRLVRGERAGVLLEWGIQGTSVHVQ